jgi:hypothetical protein
MPGANTTYRLLNQVDALSADFDFDSVARKLEGDFAIEFSWESARASGRQVFFAPGEDFG